MKEIEKLFFENPQCLGPAKTNIIWAIPLAENSQMVREWTLLAAKDEWVLKMARNTDENNLTKIQTAGKGRRVG